ncbi:MAG: exonuclease SbcCD subunit D [Promethearchaeota archaeon]
MSVEKQFRFIHTADTHLGIGLSKRSKKKTSWHRSQDFMDNFSKVVEEASKSRIDFLIHAGDVFDRSTPPKHIINAAFSQLFQIARDKPVFLVPGNHERAILRTGLLDSFSKLVNFSHPKTVSFKLKGLNIGVTGFPFKRHSFPPQFLSILEKTGHENTNFDYKILVMHQLLETATVGSQDFSFSTRHPEVLPLSMIPQSFDYIALGHVHRYQQFFSQHLREDIPVVYPGSIERTSFAECYEKKGYIIANVRINPETDEKNTELIFSELPTRPMYQMEIVVDENKEEETVIMEIEQKLGEIKRDSIVYFKVLGCTDGALGSLLGNLISEWKKKFQLKILRVKII